ncbi:MAG: pfkB family carbohydrate kinase [Chloroflexota bacterium]
MIVVVGTLAYRPAAGGAAGAPAGRAAAIARAAVTAGAEVQVVGRIGGDAAGDALVVALGREGIGHTALLRDAVHPTPLAAADGADPATAPTDAPGEAVPHRPLEPADAELALRYLPGARVVVAADPLEPPVLAAVVAGSSFATAHLVAVVTEPRAPGVPDEATVLVAPREDPGDGFARLVGAYAAGLDAGTEPGLAFREAVAATGWERAGEG